MARPFFGLCLLEESSALSMGGFGFFFPSAVAGCAAGFDPGVTSLMASGAAAGFSTGGSGVALGGPTGLTPAIPSTVAGGGSFAGAAAGAWTTAAVEPGKAGGEEEGVAGSAAEFGDG